jgi:hypothetical protein
MFTESIVEQAALSWFAVNQFTVLENGHNRRPDTALQQMGLVIMNFVHHPA